MPIETQWGSEFASVPLDDATQAGDVDQALKAACASFDARNLDSAVAHLRSLAELDPLRGASYREFASCIHLLTGGDGRGAVARLQFAMGREPPTDLVDSIAAVIARSLEADDDQEWTALAWALHSDGQSKLDEFAASGAVPHEWVSEGGYQALEELVFDRADETNDPGWVAMSALLASRQVPRRFDDDTIVGFGQSIARSQPDNPRAVAVKLQVLLALERDNEARAAAKEAIDRFVIQPNALLELLDAADADHELLELVDAACEARPDLAPTIRERRDASQRAAQADEVQRPSFARGLVEAAAVLVSPPRPQHSVVDAVLPEPPRRKDEEWLVAKAQGDKAFKQWLTVAGLIALGVGAGLWWLFGR